MLRMFNIQGVSIVIFHVFDYVSLMFQVRFIDVYMVFQIFQYFIALSSVHITMQVISNVINIQVSKCFTNVSNMFRCCFSCVSGIHYRILHLQYAIAY